MLAVRAALQRRGRPTAGRAPGPARGTNRGGAARRCHARRPPRAAQRRTGARCRAGGTAHPQRRRATTSTSRASRSTTRRRAIAPSAQSPCCLEHEAAGEDREATVKDALLAGEQVSGAPVDRRAQRAGQARCGGRRRARRGYRRGARRSDRTTALPRGPRRARWPAASRPDAGRSPPRRRRHHPPGSKPGRTAAALAEQPLGLGQRRPPATSSRRRGSRLRGQDAHAGPGTQYLLGQAGARRSGVRRVREQIRRVARGHTAPPAPPGANEIPGIGTPTASAVACTTSAGSLRLARSMNQAPSGSCSSASAAASSANRVLPRPGR